jgi:hypothetical protein
LNNNENVSVPPTTTAATIPPTTTPATIPSKISS